eukprot:s125_g10.t1
MATIIVENAFVKVNTALPDHPSSCGAMKSLLQRAALNCDCLSLGADHEAEMMAQAYAGVSTQCAASVALQNADAKTSALMRLAELSDEGLSKLKPTARLSPKRKRALVMVSDSSTALCKTNSRGVFTKSDLDQEVKWTAFTLGWSEVRYTMCWGKTLAWLQWQVGEHVKELRESHPDHIIDVVQSATPLVEKLEMYDSFHASEDTNNRQVFQNYIHNTLNVSKSEWLAEKLAPAVHALLPGFTHQESGEDHNPIVEETFAKWREEKDLILNPKVTLKPKHRIVTAEDRLWEAPDVAKAEDLTKVTQTPPEDKAISKDVPSFRKSTDVSAIDECLRDVVTQDDNGQITYEAPGTVALVDDGEYDPPIPSSIGRVIEPAPEVKKPPRKSDRDEDAMRRQMFVDQSAPQGAAKVPSQLPNEYFYNGAKHLLMPYNPEDIVGDKNVKFNHGDLKFLSMLLRGHELEDHPLKFDAGCWTDVDALLNHFNQCRERRWGIRQLLRAAKADKKGRIRLLGIDIPMRETIGQPLFPVRIRISQGHNKKLVKDVDTDLFLATRFYSLLDASEAASESSIKGVTVIPLDEVTIDPAKAMQAGCEFFVTETEGVLTRGVIPPSAVITAVDTTKKDLPIYVADESLATRKSEPGTTFRAKREYEEAASASSGPPPLPQSAAAPKAMAEKKMPKSKPPVAKLEDVAMDYEDQATREGEPLDAAKIGDEEGDTTDAGEEEEYPLGSHPCSQCQSVVANGMLFCLRCKAPQTNESAKATKRFFDNMKLRKRILATAATGANKPIEALLTADLRHLGESSKKRGQMSAEAATIRDAKDRRIRAGKLNFSTVAQRFDQDEQFRMRMMQEGRNIEDMQKFDFLSYAVLPDPGRSEEQRHLRAGSHYASDYGQTTSTAPAKLVFYAHCEVEPLRALKLIDDVANVPIGVCYMGAFLNPRLFCEIANVNTGARRILTFDGEVNLSEANPGDLAVELSQILVDSVPSSERQSAATDRLAEQNRQVAARHTPTPKNQPRPKAEPLYRGYSQAEWDAYYRSRRDSSSSGGRYSQAEWDAWNRSRRY